MLKALISLLFWPLDFFLSLGDPKREARPPMPDACACECDLTSGPCSPMCFCDACRDRYIGQRSMRN